jgi:hypothetical protein
MEARPGMRLALKPLRRYIVSPRVAKHRLFEFEDIATLPDCQLVVIARSDDYFLGVLHSRPHELWALRMGTSLEDRPRYTPSSTFETFPFPWPPGQEPTDDPRITAIADAARTLTARRDAWLNPPDAPPAELAKRTLTNLYNQRPTWLDTLHRKLDAAVLAAYGWPDTTTDDELLEWLLALNQERSTAQHQEAPSPATLSDVLSGQVGTAHSGRGNLSRETGKAFAQLMAQKKSNPEEEGPSA